MLLVLLLIGCTHVSHGTEPVLAENDSLHIGEIPYDRQPVQLEAHQNLFRGHTPEVFP